MEVVFRVSNDDVLVVCIKGDIDHHSASPLRQSIDKSMKEFKCRHLVLDFAEVGFMDSSGIGVVLGRYKKLVKTGGQLYISGCTVYIEKLLDMAGVFSLVGKAADWQDAAALIKGQKQMCMEV